MGWPTYSATWPTGSPTTGENGVKVRHPATGLDASGGRTFAYDEDDWSITTYQADIKPKTTNEIDQFMRENIVSRYEVTTGVRFAARDQFLWLETGMILSVVAVIAAGSLGSRQWTHICEENI